ncbi:hypothetical protein BGZ80_009023 [Entomortierella chlamydospora]|uniref:Uncharacterized protein n=1 Tax=Entomortierella chlamydospora TaxID=101097 RepID=A0A9P6T0X0_9FUNG|nr:hypothetical protein BGZ79_010768 [Entomortierella chlamydospora]KAG0016689.1 hypothetical protein BGZ80_009023 [Entomortierella chlamydospora]
MPLATGIIMSGLLSVAVQHPLAEQTQFIFQECRPASIKNMIVFGDSFSDTGNVFQLTNQTWPRLTFYPDGRFSNGPVWTDYVTMDQQLNLTNYAFGGATTDSKTVQGYSGSEADVPVPGFIQQIEDYFLEGRRQSMTTEDIEATLFAVSFQGNDYLFEPVASVEVVLANIERGIHRLVEVGARHILVLENFDYGRVPFFQSNQTRTEEMKVMAKKQHDQYQDLIKRLALRYGRPARRGSNVSTYYNCFGSGSSSKNIRSKVNIAFLDLYEHFIRLYDPRRLEQLGISDVIHGCVSDDARTGCSDPERHLFYDSYHPSTKIHREIANGIVAILEHRE